jgi:hypothetical protein
MPEFLKFSQFVYFLFKVQSFGGTFCLHLHGLTWRQRTPPKSWCLPARSFGFTTQKTNIDTFRGEEPQISNGILMSTVGLTRPHFRHKPAESADSSHSAVCAQHTYMTTDTNPIRVIERGTIVKPCTWIDNTPSSQNNSSCNIQVIWRGFVSSRWCESVITPPSQPLPTGYCTSHVSVSH